MFELDRDIVDEIADLEVVGAVENDVGVLRQLQDIGPVDVGDDRLDGDGGVDRTQLARGRLRLGQVIGDVVFVEEDLTLKVVRLDEIAIDDADEADAGPHQGVGDHGAERAAAAQGDTAFEQLALALFLMP